MFNYNQFNMMPNNMMNMMNNPYNNTYNNNNIYYNNQMLNQNFNNPYFNNTMMNQNMIMQQNMMIQNMIQNNNTKLMYMNNLVKQQNLKNKMDQILMESGLLNQNDNIIPKEDEKEETEEEKKEREEEEKRIIALSDVVKEQEEQKRKYEELQIPQNLNYDEVDPEFIDSFISDKELFCGRGHNLTGKWAHGENRGGRPYKPPDGWIGFGLNVINKYDNGNNDWLACDGRNGEWCIAFHGACVRSTSDQIKQIIKPILQNNLKPGAGQAYAGYDDACHPGHKVGRGVYCTPDPTKAEGYAGVIEVNGYKYKVAFMLRVKPDKIRYSSSNTDYWVLNAGDGDFSEMRPYRFLIKKVS
jgi:hypothetical protein